jgi:hypothetical protein
VSGWLHDGALKGRSSLCRPFRAVLRGRTFPGLTPWALLLRPFRAHNASSGLTTPLPPSAGFLRPPALRVETYVVGAGCLWLNGRPTRCNDFSGAGDKSHVEVHWLWRNCR